MPSFHTAILPVIAALFLFASCSSDKQVNSTHASGNDSVAQENWRLTGPVTGAIRLLHDSAGNTVISGSFRTVANDSIIFNSLSASIVLNLVTADGPAICVNRSSSPCTLLLSGAMLEGRGSGNLSLSFQSSPSSWSGRFTADRLTGTGFSPTALTLASGLPTNYPDPPPAVFNYTACADSLFLTRSWNDTDRTCTGNQLSTFVDSHHQSVACSYTLTSDRLTQTVLAVDSFGCSCTYLFSLHYLRQGTGSGLIGTWSLDTIDFTLLSGTADSDYFNLGQSLKGAILLQITPSQVIQSTHFQFKSDWASFFIREWNCCGANSDSGRYAIGADSISPICVRLTGELSREVVVIVRRLNFNTAYYSSLDSHTVHRYYEKPDSCPNYDKPDWYDNDFLYPNRKLVTPKTSLPKFNDAAPPVTQLNQVKRFHLPLLFRNYSRKEL